MPRRRTAAEESLLNTGSLLGSDARLLNTGSLLGSDTRRLSPAQESILATEREQAFHFHLHQQNLVSAASILGQVTADNGDGTYTVDLPAGGGTLTRVPATPGAFISLAAWYELERAGPGWRIVGPAPYQGG